MSKSNTKLIESHPFPSTTERIVWGVIHPGTGLLEPLEFIQELTGLPRCVLEVKSPDFSGSISIENAGYIRGAVIKDSKEHGGRALARMIKLQSGSFELLAADNSLPKELSGIRISIADLLERLKLYELSKVASNANSTILLPQIISGNHASRSEIESFTESLSETNLDDWTPDELNTILDQKLTSNAQAKLPALSKTASGLGSSYSSDPSAEKTANLFALYLANAMPASMQAINSARITALTEKNDSTTAQSAPITDCSRLLTDSSRTAKLSRAAKSSDRKKQKIINTLKQMEIFCLTVGTFLAISLPGFIGWSFLQRVGHPSLAAKAKAAGPSNKVVAAPVFSTTENKNISKREDDSFTGSAIPVVSGEEKTSSTIETEETPAQRKDSLPPDQIRLMPGDTTQSSSAKESDSVPAALSPKSAEVSNKMPPPNQVQPELRIDNTERIPRIAYGFCTQLHKSSDKKVLRKTDYVLEASNGELRIKAERKITIRVGQASVEVPGGGYLGIYHSPKASVIRVCWPSASCNLHINGIAVTLGPGQIFNLRSMSVSGHPLKKRLPSMPSSARKSFGKKWQPECYNRRL